MCLKAAAFLIFYLVAIVSVLLDGSHCYLVTVDAHGEECFYETVDSGAKLALTFEVSEGGFMDIDVNILGPDQKPIYSGERESSGRYMFAADAPGTYTYCFSNKMSTMTPKTVMFSMTTESIKVPPASHDNTIDTMNGTNSAAADGDPVQLEGMIRDLSGLLMGVKQEQEYMELRDRIHRDISESTNFRVVMWSFFEAVILVCMTLGQIYYLKRFFEVRRVV